MDDECIHGLGMPSACSVCNGRVAAERREAAVPKKVPFWLFKRDRPRHDPWSTAGRDLSQVAGWRAGRIDEFGSGRARVK